VTPARVGALVSVRRGAAGQPARDTEKPNEPRGIDEAWAHFTRRHAIAFMFMREHVRAVRKLGRGPWASLQAIAAHWQAGRTDAYPGQDRLAMISGYDPRSIRVFVAELENWGLVRLVRGRRPDGTAIIHYEPGPALLAAVERFDAKYSDERAHLREAVPPEQQEHGGVRARPLAAVDEQGRRRVAGQLDREAHAHSPDLAEVPSGGHSEVASGELSDPRDQKNSSSLSRSPLGNAGNNKEAGSKGSKMDREIALEALAALRERRFGRGVRLFDTRVVATVAACVSAIEGDREAKLRAQFDAIEHAVAVSRGGPSPNYIWGDVDHFLEHELCGRKARLERERARVRQARAAEAERLRALEGARLEREACGPPPEALRFMAELGIRSDFGRGKSQSGNKVLPPGQLMRG
jgi:hypothetical protein